MDDWQLIRRFVAEHSEEAFGELVRRNLNLVYSTALRMTQEPHLAEDVSQTVFILLTRKAGAFSEKTIVPGWLYRTTQFVASRAIRAEQRRQRREQEAFTMQQLSTSEETWQVLAPVLEDAMAGLSAADRDALVLRYFENEPLRAVGEKMGISEEAARKKVDRALARLQAIVGRQGVKVTASALAAAMSANCVTAAPAVLAGTVTSAAIAGISGSAAIPVLAKEILNAWRSGAALKWGSVAAGVLGALLFIQLVVRTPQQPETARSENSPAETATAVPLDRHVQSIPPADNSPQDSNASFAFRAIDAETYKGIPGARVLVMCATDMQNIQYLTNLVTDATGFSAVPVNASNVFAFAIGVLAENYQAQSVVFGPRQPNDRLPMDYTLPVPRGSTIGGVVHDEAGNPISGARVFVQFFRMGDSSDREFQAERPGILIEDFPSAITDAAGRWRFSSASRTNADYSIGVRHEQFPAVSFGLEESARSGRTEVLLKLADLRAGTAVMELKSGLGLSGVVLDIEGRPIQEALVSFGRFADMGNPTRKSLGDGSFHFQGLSAGSHLITVTAPMFAPERMPVQVNGSATPVEVRLKPGKLLRVRVVDENHQPVPGAKVQLQGWRGYNTLDWGGVTDESGRLEWNSAPHDELEIVVLKPGFAYSRENRITADEAEHTITLKRPLVVSGFVVDAETKLPIERFKVISGRNVGNWDRLFLVNGTNGSYQIRIDELGRFPQLRFEAEGYEPFESPPFKLQPREVAYDIQMQKLSPQQNVRGLVLLPDGSPAAGVPVALCTREKGVILGKGRFLDSDRAIIVETDREGRFLFPAAKNPNRVAAVTTSAFGSTAMTGTNRNVTVQLQPWGRIEGHLMLRGKSNADQQIQLMGLSSESPRTISFDLNAFSVRTDSAGNFVFEQAPPGEFALFRIPGMGIPFSHETQVTVPAGGTARVQMGGTGTMVRGRFSFGPEKMDWKQQLSFPTLRTKLPPIDMPKGLSREQRDQWMSDYNQSAAGIARRKQVRSYGLEVESDGTFTADGVSPGIYELSGRLNGPATDVTARMTAKPVGTFRKDVEVSGDANGVGPELIDIGIVNIEPVKAR